MRAISSPSGRPWCDYEVYMSQYADGESNKIVYDKNLIVTAWMFNTYGVRNPFALNPTNSKLKRLKI